MHAGRHRLWRHLRRKLRYRMPLSRNRANVWNGYLLDGFRVDGYPCLQWIRNVHVSDNSVWSQCLLQWRKLYAEGER